MEQPELPVSAENRLKLLATQIAELSQMTQQAMGPRRDEDIDEIGLLQGRYRALEDKLGRIGQMEADVRPDAEADFAAGADELTRWVSSHLSWIESGYHPDQRPKSLGSQKS